MDCGRDEDGCGYWLAQAHGAPYNNAEHDDGIGVPVLPCHDVVDVTYWRRYDDMSDANFEEEGPDTVQVSFLLAVGFEPTAMPGNKVCVSAADIQCIMLEYDAVHGTAAAS